MVPFRFRIVSRIEFLALRFRSSARVPNGVVNQQMWDGSGPERIVVMESQR